MLFVNKTIEQNQIIVTVSENNILDNPVYEMVIHSHYTNKTFTINLGENHSGFTERFDKFIILGDDIQNVEPGVYVYKIFNSNIHDVSLETGYLKIVGAAVESEFIEPIEVETDDDYITYES